MESLYNITNFFVIPNVDNVIAHAGMQISTYTDINDGQFYWVTPGGHVLDVGGTYATSVYSKAKLTGRIGTQLVQSDLIDVSSIKRYAITSYLAPAEQLDYIGYNGTSGSINLIDDNIYTLSVHILGRNQTDFGRQKVMYGTYESAATATQSGVAIGVTGNLLSTLLNQKPDQLIAPKAICNTATAAAYDFDATITIVKGSNIITNANASPAYNTGTAIAVGDFVRLGATATTAVSLVSDVYLITNVNGASITVDRPVQTASGAYVTANSYNQVITAVQGAAADWGIRLQGIDKKFTVGSTPFEKVRWYNGLRDFGTTTQTNTTGATEGSGFWKRVAEMEWEMGKGLEGLWWKSRQYAPAPTQRSVVDSTTPETYDILTIHFEDQMTETLGQSNNSPKTLQLALAITDNGANQIEGGTDATTAIVTVADDWIVTKWAVPGTTTQNGNLS